MRNSSRSLKITLPASLLWINKSMVTKLLRFYDYPHPKKPGKIIRGYDKAHALRTSKMAAAVAHYLGYEDDRIRSYQITCLLHDLGRAGLEQALFGKIWSWARAHDIPTRPAEWRKQHPHTVYSRETESFWRYYKKSLQENGVETDAWSKEQVEMRLGYARRYRRILKQVKPELVTMGIKWSGWMEKVALYYYYPEKLAGEPAWMRELGEILTACEQLEAYSNRERGNDYYNRSEESLAEAFAYLDSLKKRGHIGRKVLSAVRYLTAHGFFDSILAASRKRKLTKTELNYLRSL